METGVKATVGKEDLEYYVHGHKHDPYGKTPCNSECTLIRRGVVMENVIAADMFTRSADAQARQGP